MMEAVADFLHEKTKSYAPGSSEFDLFGRSSFNRYYYSLFLHVRAVFSELDLKWGEIPHGNIPNLLRGQISTEINNRRKRAGKSGDSEGFIICNRAKKSAMELREIMINAYGTRVAADYKPGILIESDGRGDYRLNAIGITAAKSWTMRARFHGIAIKRAWKLNYD